jgi:hypothetical protein
MRQPDDEEVVLWTRPALPTKPWTRLRVVTRAKAAELGHSEHREALMYDGMVGRLFPLDHDPNQA